MFDSGTGCNFSVVSSPAAAPGISVFFAHISDVPSPKWQWHWKSGSCGLPQLIASFTASALKGSGPQLAFSLASAAGGEEFDKRGSGPYEDAMASQRQLEQRIRAELSARDPDLFADPSKQEKLDRIIARMAHKQYQVELAHSHARHGDERGAMQGRWTREGMHQPQTFTESRAAPSSAPRDDLLGVSTSVPLDKEKISLKYGEVVDRRAREMMAELDPALLAEVEQFKKWRDERRRTKQVEMQAQEQQSTRIPKEEPDQIEKLSREELVDLFGSKVADMVAAVKANPDRQDYKRKLGKYLAAREAEERDKYEDEVIMGDPQHHEHFRQMVSKLEPKIRGKPIPLKDRQAESKEVYARAVAQVDEVLQAQPCAECHHRLLSTKETVGGQVIDNVLSRFRTCTGCLRSYHTACREGIMTEKANTLTGEKSPHWFHSRQCNCLQEGFDKQIEMYISKLRGGRTVEWLKGRRRFFPLEDTVTEHHKRALEDSYNILSSRLSPEEAEVALSCDYGLLLRHKGMACSAAAIAVHSPRWVQLMALATSPKGQQRHHAKFLLGHLETVLKEGGAENLAVMWPADDEAAVEACTRWLGFRFMDDRQQQDFCRTAGLIGDGLSNKEVMNALQEAVFLVKPLDIHS